MVRDLLPSLLLKMQMKIARSYSQPEYHLMMAVSVHRLGPNYQLLTGVSPVHLRLTHLES